MTTSEGEEQSSRNAWNLPIHKQEMRELSQSLSEQAEQSQRGEVGLDAWTSVMTDTDTERPAHRRMKTHSKHGIKGRNCLFLLCMDRKNVTFSSVTLVFKKNI